MIDRNQWNGRPVRFDDFNLRTGRLVTDAFQRDAQEGTFEMLVHSLRYADDGEPVFATVDDVLQQPFRLRERLAYLSAKCAFQNGLRPGDPEAEVDEDAQPNGHAEREAAGPSH